MKTYYLHEYNRKMQNKSGKFKPLNLDLPTTNPDISKILTFIVILWGMSVPAMLMNSYRWFTQ